MDVADCEVLVHITAPSAVRDDQRYLLIAQSILAFQPAIVTKVSGTDPNLNPNQDLNPPSPAFLRQTADGNDGLPYPRLVSLISKFSLE